MSRLHKEKQIKYFLRCLRSPLPDAYTSQDSNRLLLSFFIISALDLLSALDSSITLAERKGYIDWLYIHQHAKGGFRASTSLLPSPALGSRVERRRDNNDCSKIRDGEVSDEPLQAGHSIITPVLPLSTVKGDLDNDHRPDRINGNDPSTPSRSKTEQKTTSPSEVNDNTDPASIPGTYFALCTLLILGDDLESVDRQKCLQWLKSMQRPDGTFGEMRQSHTAQGRIVGGSDARLGYCAAGIRYILAGWAHAPETKGVATGDINVEALLDTIRNGQSYDGGIAERDNESHAGYTYCSLATLAFLNRSEGGDDDIKILDTGKILRWLVSRQIKVDDSDNDDDDENNNDNDDAYNDQKYPNINDNKSNVQQNKPNTVNQVNHVTNTDTQDSKMERSVERSIEWSGMNGRCNKDADTCYAFWTGAALAILNQSQLIHQPSLTKWLLEKVVHPYMGGFGKFQGDLPDIYHSYLGLAILSLMDHKTHDLRPLNATMCTSQKARDRLPIIWKGWGVDSLFGDLP